ncbi:MAG: hypothetical protein ABIA83_01780 [Patescibacteria group bacterium]
MRNQMFVCDPSGRALIGASCPDIGEMGLANTYDDSEELAQSYDPIRRYVPIDEVEHRRDSEIDYDCDDTDATINPDADGCDELIAPWWHEIHGDNGRYDDEDDHYDYDDEDDVVAERLDAVIMTEFIRRRMDGPGDPGRQPADKGRTWVHRRPRQWIVARGHDAVLPTVARRTPQAFDEAERLASIVLDEVAA